MEDLFADLASGGTGDGQSLELGPVPSVKVTYKLLVESLANTAILIADSINNQKSPEAEEVFGPEILVWVLSHALSEYERVSKSGKVDQERLDAVVRLKVMELLKTPEFKDALEEIQRKLEESGVDFNDEPHIPRCYSFGS